MFVPVNVCVFSNVGFIDLVVIWWNQRAWMTGKYSFVSQIWQSIVNVSVCFITCEPSESAQKETVKVKFKISTLNILSPNINTKENENTDDDWINAKNIISENDS